MASGRDSVLVMKVQSIQDEADNIPLRVRSKVELWNKVMKEVKLQRYAGPFSAPPFKQYIQLPIGLVPKDNGKQTRLIFHLSYDFTSKEGVNRSLNHHTLQHHCTVKYNDLDHAVNNCLRLLKNLEDKRFKGVKRLVFAKTDVRSAFRLVPIIPEHYKWLIMKAQDPESGI